MLGYPGNPFNTIRAQMNYSTWASKLIWKWGNKQSTIMESHPLCSWRITNKAKNIYIRLIESRRNIPHRKWRRQNSRKYMKGKKVMKKILAKKILKQCFISSWRISRAFSATVYSHLLVCKKQVTAALFSKLRINKMKSPVNMLKIQISGNFQRPALAFRTKTRMKNVRK